MKLEQLKKILKEVVKEAVKEELSCLLTEYRSNNTSTQINKSIDSSYEEEPKKTNTTGIARLIEETRNSMTREDLRNIVGENFNSGREVFSFNTNTMLGKTNQPGLDLSNLPFVKNAAAIYNKAVEKSKN